MDNETLEKFIYELEISLMIPEVRRSPDKIQALLKDDFFEFCCSGKRYDYQIGDVFGDSYSYEIEDFAVKELSKYYVHATYQTVREGKNGKKTRQLRSSLWQKDNGAWKMAFHQGTPIE